jgi:hypothetical protein
MLQKSGELIGTSVIAQLMYVESYLLAIGAFLSRASGEFLQARPLLYTLIVLVLIPLALFVASQAFAAIVGHYAVKICVRKDRAEIIALEDAKAELGQQNGRLIAVNAFLMGDRERLRRENGRLLERALKAELENKTTRPAAAGGRAQPAKPRSKRGPDRLPDLA